MFGTSQLIGTFAFRLMQAKKNSQVLRGNNDCRIIAARFERNKT